MVKLVITPQGIRRESTLTIKDLMDTPMLSKDAIKHLERESWKNEMYVLRDKSFEQELRVRFSQYVAN